jgi:hypothetical protein
MRRSAIRAWKAPSRKRNPKKKVTVQVPTEGVIEEIFKNLRFGPGPPGKNLAR